MSRCLDIVTVRCNGAVGIFILTNGFRNIKMYNLGLYPWFKGLLLINKFKLYMAEWEKFHSSINFSIIWYN